MKRITDFKAGQKKLSAEAMQGIAAESKRQQQLRPGMNFRATRGGVVYWPTFEKKQRSSPAASGAVQAFYIVGLALHPDAWLCAKADFTLDFPIQPNDARADTWVAKPMTLRPLYYDAQPFTEPNSTAWFRYEYIAPQYLSRRKYTGPTQESQTQLLHTENMNPDPRAQMGTSGVAVPGSPTVLRNIFSRFTVAIKTTTDVVANGSPVEWLDMNMAARHWVRLTGVPEQDMLQWS